MGQELHRGGARGYEVPGDGAAALRPREARPDHMPAMGRIRGPEADLEHAQAAGGEEAEVRRGAGRRSEPGDEARCLRQLEAPDVRLRRTQLAF